MQIKVLKIKITEDYALKGKKLKYRITWGYTRNRPFPSYLNAEGPILFFLSWFPDPDIAISAFTLDRKKINGYLYNNVFFPSTMARNYKYNFTFGAKCIVVFSRWESQPWFPKLGSEISSKLPFSKSRESLLYPLFRTPYLMVPMWRQLTLGKTTLSDSHSVGTT